MTQQHPALAYAESLGFQSVFDELLGNQKQLDDLFADLDKAQDERRFVSDAIWDREMQLLSTTQAANPDWSANKVEQQMKVIKHGDDTLKELRLRQRLNHAELDGLEIDKEMTVHRIKTLQARMVELGGYFNYLAAVKQAETLTKTQENK